MSSLWVNFHKSKLIGINLKENFMEATSVFLVCGTSGIPFKFLRIPIGANPRRRDTWKPVVDSMRARLSSWEGCHLSMGARVTFINSILSSLRLYFFSFYKAPKVVLNELIKIQRIFMGGQMMMRGKYVGWLERAFVGQRRKGV